jgi:putative SOS response-associated peptidase YedK
MQSYASFDGCFPCKRVQFNLKIRLDLEINDVSERHQPWSETPLTLPPRRERLWYIKASHSGSIVRNMCGRYALSLRPSQVRQRLNEQNMPADDAPDDDNDRIRQSYNFAPGYHGLIYRADTPDSGAGSQDENNEKDDTAEPPPKRAKISHATSHTVDGLATAETKYKLQAAKWGLVPFWTKRAPDYGSQMRTINCRDDSLIENRGMWNTMKQRKRCIVVAEGFYEWLKKNNGKDKLPHFVKRKDGELMCFAGLWDCVQYEGSDDKLYSYTVITTDSNKQLKFLHDRMPVILEAGSDAMKTWLDPGNAGWSKELQSLLKPYDGELECYPVDKAVGKVGNNSPQFMVPIDSKENKNNIANFFGSRQSPAKAKPQQKTAVKDDDSKQDIKQEPPDPRSTSSKIEAPESNAPMPEPAPEYDPLLSTSQQIKKETSQISDSTLAQAASELIDQNIKLESSAIDDESLLQAAEDARARKLNTGSGDSPKQKKSPAVVGGRKMRSATSNNTAAKSPTKEGNAKITSFFGK